MSFRHIAISLVGLAAWSTQARADSGFRCGTRLVDLDNAMYEVQEKCGEPDAASHRVERRVIRQTIRVRRGNVEESIAQEREIEVPVDEWTYDFGPGSFLRYAIFENGRLVNVTTGGYGKRLDR